jgi:hypothetical protein
LAGVFLLLAVIFGVVGRRKKIVAKNHAVVMERNNGVVIAGDVGGNVNASVGAPGAAPAPKDSRTLRLLNVLAAFSAILSAVLAALAYFYPLGEP